MGAPDAGYGDRAEYTGTYLCFKGCAVRERARHTLARNDRRGMLGSANMDARSFRLNFEITALLYDQGVAAELARSIDGFCDSARRIERHDVWHRRPLRQLGEGAARLFAPLL
jgi:cardiolipin synthase A/B